MHWEAVAINADFWSQVLQGKSLQPLDFALGAAMATRRAQLTDIGGFEVLADDLADDYQLGNRIARDRQKHRPLSRGGGLPGCIHDLERGMDPSIALGADYPGQQTPALWLQHSQQCHTLAITLVFGTAHRQGAVISYRMPLVRVPMTLTLQKRLGPAGPNRHCWLAPIKDLLQFAL